MTEKVQDFELEFPGRKSIRCTNGSVSLTTDSPGAEAVVLDIGGEISVTTLPVKVGELPESSALRGKRRPHASESGTEYTFEMENSIPFGEEPSVLRKMRIDGELLSASMDIRMRSSCRAEVISGGGLLFKGPIRRVFFPGEEFPETEIGSLEEGTVFYDSELPPPLMVLETRKSCAEFCPGDDLWRWISAKRFQGKSRFTIKKENGEIRFDWELFRLDPGVEELPDGRNLRLTWLISWKLKRASRGKKYKFRETFNAASISCPPSASRLTENGKKENVCFACQAAENVLKKWIRSLLGNAKEGDVYGITHLAPGLCFDAGHLERAKAGTLMHRDLAALLDFKNWANRQLGRKGASLELVAEEDSPYKGRMTFR